MTRRRAGAAHAGLIGALLASAPAAGEPLSGLVYLRDVAPAVRQDIKYAGADNFTGAPLPGYEAAECLLRSEAATALRRVADDLAARGLLLKVYDCYRPARASEAMARWVAAPTEDAYRRFHPNLAKADLIRLGYIARRSGHARGTVVDAALVARDAPEPVPFDPARRYGSCTGPAAQRAPDDSLDMGTGFDCFDPMSATSTPAIGADQRRHREALVAAMRAQGFTNYPREWWHFAHASAGVVLDLPIRPRAGGAR
jgi:D-alanyl-D-alanine dipeptidase